MSDQYLQEYPNYQLPVSFRVIGFGERSKILINKINSLKYPSVRTFNYEESKIVPEEEDLMVILINPSNKDIQYFSKSFYQAGILTLVVSSKDFSKIKDCFDSFTKVSQNKILPTIKGILDSLFHIGPISFDFNDIKLSLKDSSKFLVKTFITDTSGEPNIKLCDGISHELKEYDYENIAFILSFNKETNTSFLTSEIRNFQIYLKSLSEDVNFIWGVQNDETLKQDQIKITVVLSGKNLKF